MAFQRFDKKGAASDKSADLRPDVSTVAPSVKEASAPKDSASTSAVEDALESAKDQTPINCSLEDLLHDAAGSLERAVSDFGSSVSQLFPKPAEQERLEVTDETVAAPGAIPEEQEQCDTEAPSVFGLLGGYCRKVVSSVAEAARPIWQPLAEAAESAWEWACETCEEIIEFINAAAPKPPEQSEKEAASRVASQEPEFEEQIQITSNLRAHQERYGLDELLEEEQECDHDLVEQQADRERLEAELIAALEMNELLARKEAEEEKKENEERLDEEDRRMDELIALVESADPHNNLSPERHKGPFSKRPVTKLMLEFEEELEHRSTDDDDKEAA